jgi:hypothetical protein
MAFLASNTAAIFTFVITVVLVAVVFAIKCAKFVVSQWSPSTQLDRVRNDIERLSELELGGRSGNYNECTFPSQAM